jgi:hypothetical protein
MLLKHIFSHNLISLLKPIRDNKMKRVLLSAICGTLFGQVASADWNSSKEFSFTNDFSETIYKDGTGYNRTGPHPKAAQLADGQLVVTLTEKMLDVGNKKRVDTN